MRFYRPNCRRSQIHKFKGILDTKKQTSDSQAAHRSTNSMGNYFCFLNLSSCIWFICWCSNLNEIAILDKSAFWSKKQMIGYAYSLQRTDSNCESNCWYVMYVLPHRPAPFSSTTPQHLLILQEEAFTRGQLLYQCPGWPQRLHTYVAGGGPVMMLVLLW